MDTIYLLPGEERCVDFRDANGVPKVHYTYCSIRGKLFNCTCCTKDEAQRLCEDWLIKQDRCQSFPFATILYPANMLKTTTL